MRPSPTTRTGPSCRVVVAAAGYGKTTALRGWYRTPDVRWHRGVSPGRGSTSGPQQQDQPVPWARLVLEEVRDGARQIVIDDLPRLAPDSVVSLVDALAELPATVAVTLSSRWPLEPPVGRLGGRIWDDVGPADLSLSLDQVANLLAQEYDLTDPNLPELVREVTAGWPVLVHLTAETLSHTGVPNGSLLPAIAEPGGPVAAYLTEEVLAALPPEATRLIRQVGDLAPVSVGLCRALGHQRAAEAVRLLNRTGLLSRVGTPPLVPGGPPPEIRVVPVVAETVRLGRRRLPAGRALTVATAAAEWYERNGPAVAAARTYLSAGQPGRCAQVLDTQGEVVLSAGHAAAVAELIGALPDDLRTRRIRLLYGDALRSLGHLDAADRVYAAITAAEPGPILDAGLAWRIGRIHYQRGDPRAALRVYEQAGARDGNGTSASSPGNADEALLTIWAGQAHLLAGDTVAATACARRGISLAAAIGHDGALASGYLSLAVCLGVTGDTVASEEHYGLATAMAKRAGDLTLLTRISTNRAYQLLRTANYAEALANARQSARYASAAGLPNLLAIATCNEADALMMLGRFDEAVKQYERAAARYQRIGSRRLAGAQLGLAEVYRRRGWPEQARAAYEAAVRIARETANAQILVPALAGLAMVLLPGDPATAAEYAACAVKQASEEFTVPALLAQGWVALHQGDRVRAAEVATELTTAARTQGDRAGLAEALELRAAVHEEPSRARETLREAHAIWADVGATVEAARILVTMGHLPEAGIDERLRGLVAAEQLSTANARVEEFRHWTSLPAAADQPVPPEISVRALGRFEVRVGGAAVPPSRWQSRKARDLLRILVARRGRPVPREELCELLWPDDDRAKTAHRLSVLLSIVRGVLDPGRTVTADHFLVADQVSIAIDIARVRVDVEEFLACVGHARRLVDAGDLATARTLLTTAERHYGGEAFEDEPYAAWSDSLREEVRAAQSSVLRMLARVSRAATGPEAAVGYLLRLLQRDPFDEAAHRALVRSLVATGQHGEARRAFARYGQAMRSIGVSAPDEALLAPPSPTALSGRSR